MQCQTASRGEQEENVAVEQWRGLWLLCGMLILQMSWTAKVKIICNLPASEPEFYTAQRGMRAPLSKKEGRRRELYAKKP